MPAAASTASALLGKGEFSAKLSFVVAGASKGAREAVEKAGGSIEIPTVVPAADKAKEKKGSTRNTPNVKGEGKAKKAESRARRAAGSGAADDNA